MWLGINVLKFSFPRTIGFGWYARLSNTSLSFYLSTLISCRKQSYSYNMRYIFIFFIWYSINSTEMPIQFFTPTLIATIKSGQ